MQNPQKTEEKPNPSTGNDQPHTQGADNIDTVKKPHGKEGQEVVGTEDQRLPAYEVGFSKEHVEKGLGQAGANVDQNAEEKGNQ